MGFLLFLVFWSQAVDSGGAGNHFFLLLPGPLLLIVDSIIRLHENNAGIPKENCEVVFGVVLK
jgi:hypothetical protein